VVAASDQDISTREDIPEIKLKWEENGNSNSNGRRDTVSKERVGAGKKDTGKLTKKPVKALSCIETDK
ncbi:hypothetical protein Tco_1468586, partial [Tanacetum coccineum]